MQAHAACHITGLFRMLSRHLDSVQDPLWGCWQALLSEALFRPVSRAAGRHCFHILLWDLQHICSYGCQHGIPSALIFYLCP